MDLQDALAVFESLTVVVVAGTAFYGIRAWRREAIGRKRIDLSEEVLAKFYQARDVIREIRSPHGYVGEGRTRVRADTETSDESRRLDDAYVVFERYERHRTLFAELHALRYRFMALHGKQTEEPFLVLQTSLNQVFVAARELPALWERQDGSFDSESDRQEHREQLRKARRTYWFSGGDDEIEAHVDQAVVQIEEICQPLIQQGVRAAFLQWLPWRKDGA